MPDIRDDIKPAAFTGGATAVLGTIGGILPALMHSVLSTAEPLSFTAMLTSDLATVAAIGVGQGLAATAAALARGKGEFYISPRRGLTAAFAVGVFNGLMYFVQMAVPATELGWVLDLALLGTAGAAAGWAAVHSPSTPSKATIS